MPAQPYILPTATVGYPNGLTLTQFLQTVFVGISGLAGSLVRPKWQPEPPKQPDITVDWMAMGVDTQTPDANGYTDTQEDGTFQTQRHELLDISCDIYGPNCERTAGLIRDGFQVQTNLESLRQANMGFVETGPMRHLPDLVNQRFIDRIIMNVIIRREIQRVYPVPTLLSASGAIHTLLGGEDYLLNWGAEL